jgi:hypothetical protein
MTGNRKFNLAIAVLAAVIFVGYFFLFSAANFGPGLADYSFNIAHSCTLDRSSAHEITISCSGIDQDIDAKVYKIGWNDSYLVAETNPVTKRAYPDDPNNTYTVPDESTTFWWIRDLGNKKAYGPMSESEFKQKKAAPKIPEIQLMTVDEAKGKGALVSGSTQ